jgi:exopolysaccharide biosynthesis polyprenyl glycosylphosphotransferase
VEEFDGLPLVNLQDSPLYGWNLVAKRIVDIVLSSVALLITAPVQLVLAAVVRLTSPGPILYRQERMGLDGRTFQMLKFRSMIDDAEDDTGAVWATRDDRRRTSIGAMLRLSSLDELPQLFNVLRGEMSLVGPRPERPVFIEEFRKRIPKYMLRHKVKAGITGWAQVNGWRGDTSLERRIECDLYYIEHWSLPFDLKILWLSLWKGFIHKNAV